MCCRHSIAFGACKNALSNSPRFILRGKNTPIGDEKAKARDTAKADSDLWEPRSGIKKTNEERPAYQAFRCLHCLRTMVF